MRVIIPHKLGYCSDCTENSLFNKCDKFVNQTKEFSADLNDIKRQHPNSFRHMLPWYVGDLE